MKVDLYTKIVLTAIAIGLFLNVAGDSKLSVVKDVSAKVAGMDKYGLKYDYDFKGAVEDIAEDVIEGCSASGYVDEDGGHLTLDVDC